MKNIETLHIDISNLGDKIIDNLIKAQRTTAEDLLKDVRYLAPKKTGVYKDSIQISDTKYENDHITTSVYTDAMVYDSACRGYNLGKLIEYGTRPHSIEPAHAQCLKFEINGQTIYASHVFHPGTTANPHFQMALQRNIPLYHLNIGKAIKEAKI